MVIFYRNNLIYDSFAGLTCNFTHGWRAKWAAFCSNNPHRKPAVTSRDTCKRPDRGEQLRLDSIYRDLFNDTVDNQNRSNRRHVRWSNSDFIQIKYLFCFHRHKVWMYEWLWFVVYIPLCITSSGYDLQANGTKNRKGFCFSAPYKGLSAGMTMQVWRLEPHFTWAISTLDEKKKSVSHNLSEEWHATHATELMNTLMTDRLTVGNWDVHQFRNKQIIFCNSVELYNRLT